MGRVSGRSCIVTGVAVGRILTCPVGVLGRPDTKFNDAGVNRRKTFMPVTEGNGHFDRGYDGMATV